MIQQKSMYIFGKNKHLNFNFQIIFSRKNELCHNINGVWPYKKKITGVDHLCEKKDIFRKFTG